MTEENTVIPIVFSPDAGNLAAAQALAGHLNTVMTTDPKTAEQAALTLRLDSDGLALTGNGLTVRADFTRMLPRLRQGNLRGELLVRAAKFKGESGELTAVDATAGLGDDALLLAAAGFRVALFEYDPVIAALLKDAMRRAMSIPELTEIVDRMTLHEDDSISCLPRLSPTPDIVLLDPMFPEKQKSALVKKKFQLIHCLKSPCADEEALLNAAIAACPRKIVVKRPAKGPFLAGRKPTFSLAGNAIRYDCLVFPKNQTVER